MFLLFPGVCSAWDGKNQGGKKNETFQIMDGSVIAMQQFIGAVIGRIGLHDGICGNCKPGAWHPDQ